MEVYSDKLSFSVSEASALTVIIMSYLGENEATVDIDDELRLRNLWSIVGGIGVSKFAYTVLESSNNLDNLEALLEKTREATGSPQDPKTVAAFLIADEVEVVGGREFLPEAFVWARENMVQGSEFMQRKLNKWLNSGFEDLEVSRELGCTNSSYADNNVTDFVLAGIQADHWLELIDRN